MEVYKAIFKYVDELLAGENTVIESIMLDFQDAARGAALLVWCNIKVLGKYLVSIKKINYFIFRTIFYLVSNVSDVYSLYRLRVPFSKSSLFLPE